jgi:hypothetical protein
MTYNPARNSDLARRDVEADSAALGVVSLYGALSEHGFTPSYAVPIDTMVARYRASNPSAISAMALRKVQESLMGYVTNSTTYLGHVSLDFDGVRQDHVTWNIYNEVSDIGLPQIAFGALTTSSYLHRTEGFEAIAVYYLPPSRPRRWTDKQTGEPVCVTDNLFRAGYHGVVRCFRDLDDAESAKRELASAIRTIRTKQPATVDDVVAELEDMLPPADS